MTYRNPETVTLNYVEHSRVLVEGLWNLLTTNYRVEDVPFGCGFLKAHRLILDVFLPPERTIGNVTMSDDHPRHLQALLEFMYKGTVIVHRDKLDGLLLLAKEVNFKMLVDAVTMSEKKAITNATKIKTKRTWGAEFEINVEGECENRILRSRTKGTTNRPWEPEVQIVAVPQVSQRPKTPVLSQTLKSKVLTIVRRRTYVKQKPAPKRKCPDCEYETRNLDVLRSHQTVIHANEKPFNCVKCTFTTCWKGALQHHKVVSHDKENKNLVCETCKREFKNRAGLSAHQRTHTKKRKGTKVASRASIKKSVPDSLVCTTCGKTSKTKAGLVEHQRTHTQERPYKCPHCDKRFNQTSNRSKHVRSEHTNCPGGFVCDACEKVFKSRAELVGHKQTHTQERRYKCPYCDKCFNQPSNRCQHIKRIHTEGPGGFVCDICDKGFKTRDGLLLHRRIHAPERRFLCPHCGKGFNQSSGLNSHVVSMHTGGATIGHFVCETCGKRMKTRASMQQHQRIHTQERPFKCPHCDKGFNQKSGMNSHIARAHTQGPGAFVCDTCGKRNKTRDGFIEHRRTHTQERPYKCPFCDKRFNQTSNRSKHVRSAHTQGPGSFACETCEKVFKSRPGLLEHRRTHTQERPYKCPHCDKRFNQPSNRSKHVQRAHREGPVTKESFVCETCGKQASSRDGLSAHRRTHNAEKLHKCPQCAYAAITKQRLTAHMDVVHEVGPSRFTCEVCNKRFCSRAVLLRHNLIHTKEKPFKCEHCPYASNQKATLKQHFDTLHGEGRFRCEICGKSIQSASLLIAHKRSHTQEKPFECPHCSHRANRKENLTRHIDVVHGLGTGKCTCETCGKSLNSARQLARHRRTHAKEKPNAQSDNRNQSPASERSPPWDRESDNQHIPLTHAPGPSGLSCHICGERCSTVDELSSHRRGHASVYPLDLFRFQSMQHL